MPRNIKIAMASGWLPFLHFPQIGEEPFFSPARSPVRPPCGTAIDLRNASPAIAVEEARTSPTYRRPAGESGEGFAGGRVAVPGSPGVGRLLSGQDAWIARAGSRPAVAALPPSRGPPAGRRSIEPVDAARKIFV